MCPLLAEMLNRTDTEIKLLLLLLLLLGTSTKTAANFFSFSCLYNLCVSLLFCLKACEYEKALFLKLHEDWNDSYFKTSSTLHRFQTKTILFCSGYGYRPHYNAENDQRKRIVWKTHSRVERFENSTICKRCFPSLDGKNDATWKRWRHHNNTTWLQTIQPWVSKIADRRLTLLRLPFDWKKRTRHYKAS